MNMRLLDSFIKQMDAQHPFQVTTSVLIRLFIFVLLIMAGLAGNARAELVNLPPDLTAEVQRAEHSGAALYLAYNSPDDRSATAVADIKIAQAAIHDLCEFHYRPVLVIPKSGDFFSIYFIGITPSDKTVVVGRHFRVDLSNDGKRVLSVTSSTKSCLVIPPPPVEASKAVGPYLTHLLSATPTEFHVFLSLLHQQSFTIGTNTGVWKTEYGQVQYMGHLSSKEASQHNPNKSTS